MVQCPRRLDIAPFDWEVEGLPRSPVPVDALPDIGENPQIVFSARPRRSPQDAEDQITNPLTVSLLGIPGVSTIRSQSMFCFSSISVFSTTAWSSTGLGRVIDCVVRVIAPASLHSDIL